MKNLNKIPLRMRITLLTGAMVLIASFALTIASMINANGQFIEIKKAMAVTLPIEYYGNAAQTTMTYSVKDSVAAMEIVPAEVLAVEASRATARFNVWSLLALLLVAMVGMGLSYYVAGRALAPVRRLSLAASGIGAQNLKTRLVSGGTHDEIDDLTHAFNEMLNRLQKAFENQKRFSSNVAHELKTPLATMKLCVQTAQLEQAGDAEFFEVMERAVDRLTGVVSDLLLLTNESWNDRQDEIPLLKLLRDVADELMPLYADKHLKFAWDLPETEVKVCGNAGLVRNIFLNLMENGMKYNCNEGTLTVRVQCDAAGTQVVVEDDGQGIAEAALPYLFEPFYCVDPSRSRKLGGAGLGLSIAKTIAEKHGWTVAVQSALGEGAAFIIYIPNDEWKA